MERLENYIKQVRGISYSPKDISDIPKADYVPVLKANNIKENGLDLTNLIYIHKSKVKTEQFIKKGDLLLAASSGSIEIVGKNIYFTEDFEGSFGAFCKVVRPNKKINSRYLSVFFKTPNYKRHIKKVIQGANINNLKNDDIDSLKIPILNENYQIHVAEILTQAENLILQRKESIALLNELLKSTFWEMFGDPVRNEKNWDISNIGKECSVKGGKRIPKDSKLVKENTGYPYIKAGNIKKGKITTTDLEFLTPELRHLLKRYTVEKGDVCITVVGANIGDIGIVPEELHLANLTENANKVLIKDKLKLNNIYLGFYLMMDFVQNNFNSKIRAAGVPKLALFRIEEISLLMPPIELQNKFATIVEKVEVLKKEYEASLKELENMYGVLSQKAFKGELKLSKVNLEIYKEEIKTPVAGSIEPSGEGTEILELTKKEIKELKKLKEKSKDKIDITDLSIADFYGVPLDIQAKRENIDFDFVGDDLFYQFLLKDHFRKEPFTSVILYEKLHNYFYHIDNMDFDNKRIKKIIFDFLDTKPPLLEQFFDDSDKTIKLKLTDEAFKA